MRRITAKSFIDAVKRQGTVPRRCLWIKDRVRGNQKTVEVCAIGALCVDAGRRDYRKFARDKSEGLGLTEQYISGFITGFDGRKPGNHWDDLGERQTGWEDGIACAVAAFDEKLHLEYPVIDTPDPSPWMDPGDDVQEDQYVYCGMGL